MNDLMPRPDNDLTQGVEFTPVGLKFNNDISFDEWLDLGEWLKYAEGAVHWWIGDFLNYGESKYGETYSQFYNYESGNGWYKYQTLRDDKWLAGCFELSFRKDNLSHGHHKQVAKMNPQDREYWLGIAIKDGLTVKELRRRIKRGKLEDKRKELLNVALEEIIQGRFSVIYADPPWQYSNEGFMGAAEDHYPTMPTDDICTMGVEDCVSDNAILFLWATNPLLLDALQVINAWGFNYKTNFCWIKNRSTYGKLGFYNYSRHELLLVASRGSFLPDDQTLFDSVIEAAKDKHSKKPEQVYSMIEEMYPGFPYLELFARQKREGWHVFGNEVKNGFGLVTTGYQPG